MLTKKGWKKNNKNNNNGKVQVKQEVSYASEGGKSDECYTITCDEEISGKWILNSGCSYHICSNKKWFTTYRSTDGGTVLMDNNHSCKTVGLGSIRIKMYDGVVRTLMDVRHVPDLRKNLISVGALDSGGCKIVTWNGVKKVVRGSLIVMKGIHEGNLYALQGTTITEEIAVGASESGGDPCECTELRHRRLGHMSEKGLDLLVKKDLLKNLKKPCMDFCEHCMYGKAHRIQFQPSKHRSRGILDYVHTDVWGPASVTSKGGSRYFVTFVDDYSRYAWIYFLKHKNEEFDTFKKWKAMGENRTGKKLKTLRSNNGTEYTDGAFKEFCGKEGIARHWTVRNTQQQNGVAERLNRTFREKSMCMRSYAGLARVGCKCFLHSEPISTFKVRWRCTLQGIDRGTCRPTITSTRESLMRGPRRLYSWVCGRCKRLSLWCVEDSKFIISRDVNFDENSMIASLKAIVPGGDDVETTKS